MVNDACPMPFYPRDFRFERGNARVELLDRQRIEVLTRELRQRIVASKRQILVGIHKAKR
jgi:hypothetical protein